MAQPFVVGFITPCEECRSCRVSQGISLRPRKGKHTRNKSNNHGKCSKHSPLGETIEHRVRPSPHTAGPSASASLDSHEQPVGPPRAWIRSSFVRNYFMTVPAPEFGLRPGVALRGRVLALFGQIDGFIGQVDDRVDCSL